MNFHSLRSGTIVACQLCPACLVPYDCLARFGTWLSGHEPKQKHHHGCGGNANPRWFCLGDSPWCPGGLIWHCNSGEGQFPWCGHAAAHGASAPVFLRDVAFGTYVPKQAPTKKSAHHTPDATSLGCNHLGGRLTRPHAAGITQIGPQTARLPQFGVGVGGALLTCLP